MCILDGEVFHLSVLIFLGRRKVMSNKILVRYGELSTKGKNKKIFIQQLAKNIKSNLNDFPTLKIKPEYDFLHIELNDAPEKVVLNRLQFIFGIQSYAPVYQVEKNLNVVKHKIKELLSNLNLEHQTFKIIAKRSDHQFELNTQQLNLELGEYVLDEFPQLTVDVKNPNIPIKVEVRKEAIFISLNSYKGAGGLPVGVSGRGMMMLSGGIDSPVASFLAMKRGLEIEMVHFYSPPYTSAQALLKTEKLTQILSKFGGTIQFIQVPFTKIQEEIKAKCPDNYAMTLNRRFMLRITDELRKVRKGLVILNGESVGQVASQTLHSMVAINNVTATPIIRPVATMDKLEIIELSQKIGTFDISIEPFEDCCTIFAPTAPKTKPRLDKVEQYEQLLNVEALVQEAVQNSKVYSIGQKTNLDNFIVDIDGLF